MPCMSTVCACPFLTSHANLQFGSFSTLSDVLEFEAFCKVLLMLETLSPVSSGHTIDSLGGTPATFMVEA